MIKLGVVLQNAGLVTARDIEEAVHLQKKNGKFLGDILVDSGKITNEQLLRCLSKQMKVGFVNLKEKEIDKECLDKVPIRYVWSFKIMPVSCERNLLTVAFSDPMNMGIVNDLKSYLKMRIKPVLATSVDVDDAIHKYYQINAENAEEMLDNEVEREKEIPLSATSDETDIEHFVGDGALIKLISMIAIEARKRKANEVHLELYDAEIKVLYRIEGTLHESEIMDDVNMLYAVVADRIRIMLGVNINDPMVPPFGELMLRLGSRHNDINFMITYHLGGADE